MPDENRSQEELIRELDELRAEVAALRACSESERALLAVNHRMKRDLDAAARIQKSLLPTRLPELSSVRFVWDFRPCEELAGDTLNVLRLDDEHLGIYVLDVSGHGVSSALLAVTLHRVLSVDPDRATLLRRSTNGSSTFELVPPAQVAEQLNREFSMNLAYRQYFTILYGILNTRTHRFRFVSGGHWGPIYVPRNDTARLLHARGFPIGVFEDTSYEEHFVDLEPGDRVYLYSDGIPEARNPEGELFDYKRIARSLDQCRSQKLKRSMSALMRRLDEFTSGKPQEDDISLLAFEILD